MVALESSILNSEKLQRHINYMFTHGALFKIMNNNLLYHGYGGFCGVQQGLRKLYQVRAGALLPFPLAGQRRQRLGAACWRRRVDVRQRRVLRLRRRRGRKTERKQGCAGKGTKALLHGCFPCDVMQFTKPRL